MSFMVVAIAVLAGAIASPLLRARPRLVFVGYLIAVLAIPYWVGLSVAGQFIPLSLVAAGVGVAALMRTGLPWDSVDRWLLIMALLVLCGLVLGLANRGPALSLIGSWFAPYVLGRLVGYRLSFSHVSVIIASATVALSLQAIVEFVFDWHPFTEFLTASQQGQIWGGIQYRSAFPRSEGALGHSISLGGAIAVGVPFVLLAPWSIRTRTMFLALATVGVSVTFSRNALIALGLAVLLTCAFSTRSKISKSARAGFVTVTAILGMTAVPIYLRLIDGGTGVLAASTDYRAGYISLVPSIRVFGISDSYFQYEPGKFGWYSSLYPGNVVVTLDNTLLLTALQFGAVPALALLLLLATYWLKLWRSRDNPAAIAFCAQYFTIATVAMITQYPYILWLVAGLGVTYLQRANQSETEDFDPSNFGGPNVTGPPTNAKIVKKSRHRRMGAQ